MPRQIYAIYDIKAEAIVGGLSLHYHDAPAIRMFGDIASMRESAIGLHPEDYHLLQLGTLEDSTSITPCQLTVLTGAQWLASQQPQEKTQDAR